MIKRNEFIKVDIEQIIDNLPSAIIVLNRETLILLANRMASMFANRAKDHFFGLRGGDAFNCIHANDVIEGCGYGPVCKFCTLRNTFEETFRTLSGIMMVEAEMEFYSKGKRDLRLSTTYLAENDIVILVIEDITDIKKAEQQNLERNKLLAAVETAGAVCHEMNQPLQVISGYIDLMTMAKDITRENYPYLSEMKEQLDRLGKITRSLQGLRSFKSKEYVYGTEILDLEKSSIAD